MAMETIKIVTEVLDHATGKLRGIDQTIRRVGNSQQILTDTFNRGAKGQKEFKTSTIQTMKGMHRFRMELLSVMFFGMALNRVFMGMLQPAFEATGIFELLSATLLSVFIPVAIQTLEALLPIMEAFMALDDPTKLFIGQVVALGAAASGALMAFGMLSLGIDGMKTAFPILAKLGKGVLGIIPDSVKTAIVNALGSVKSAIVGVWDKLSAFAGKVFETAVNFVHSGIDAVTNAVSRFATWSAGAGWTGKVIPATIAIGLTWAGAEWTKQQEWGSTAAHLGAIGTGAAAGFAAGTIIPGAGNVIGALLGALTGGVLSLLNDPNVISGIMNVPTAQFGGIVKRPTLAMVGERGPEAIVPLGEHGGGNVFHNQYTLNIDKISSDVDIRLLGEQLADIQGQQLKGMLVR